LQIFILNDRKIKCDLSIYNPAAMRSTELLKAYAQADPRVAPLVFAVKYWARYRKLIDPYHRDDMINSYTHTLMLLAFLMMERVIPPLQQICCDQPIKDHLEASHQKHEGKFYLVHTHGMFNSTLFRRANLFSMSTSFAN
jgi:DNA polymerase sigma